MQPQDSRKLIGSPQIHGLLAAGFVVAATISIELIFGVHFGEILRYGIFEAAYVFLPGWMAYLALSRNPVGLLRQIAIGAGVGYALECLAFAATGACGVPAWFAAYPAVVAIIAGPMVWRRWRSDPRILSLPSAPPLFSWALAFLCVAGLIYLAMGFFMITPLPHSAGVVSYAPDTVWDISCAAEAKNHWPIMDARLAGETFYYYTFVFIHMGAASRFTGLGLSLIVLRLFSVSFFLVLTLQCYVAGSAMGKSRRCGLLAVIVTLFIGSVQIWPLNVPGAFMIGSFFIGLYMSPTYFLGLLLFTPLVIEMHDLLTSRGQQHSWGSWLVIALLLVASGGAKGTVPPVFAGGLGLYFAWRLLANRTLDWAALAATVLGVATFFGWNRLVYSHASLPIVVHPLATITYLPFVRAFIHFKEGAAHIPAINRVLAGMSRVPILRKLFHPRKSVSFPIGATILLVTPLVIAGMFGLRAFTTVWVLSNAKSRRDRAQMLLLSLFFISLLPFLLLDEISQGQAYFLLNGIAMLSISAACALDSLLDESAGWRPARKWLLLGVPALLAVNGLFDTPVSQYARFKAAASHNAQVLNGMVPGDMSNGLLEGLEWLNLHSSPSDVIAVNNQFLDTKKTIPRDFYYSAFSERRVFLEGWAYSNQRSDAGRITINQGVFDNADPAALRTLVQQYGVRWLVVDKNHGSANPLLSTLAIPVFSNPDIDIYSVGPIPPAQAGSGSQGADARPSAAPFPGILCCSIPPARLFGFPATQP